MYWRRVTYFKCRCDGQTKKIRVNITKKAGLTFSNGKETFLENKLFTFLFELKSKRISMQTYTWRLEKKPKFCRAIRLIFFDLFYSTSQ